MCDIPTKVKDISSGKMKSEMLDTIMDSIDQKPIIEIKIEPNFEPSLKSTNEDVQRAIEGLKEIPDEELQEFLDDEDFMKGLDVVDAWEGDEDKNRDAEHTAIRGKEKEQKHPSRDRHRDHKGSHRERSKREDKKHEETRRDPSKSTKDIERDKIRTKRDNESKLLAEKEKAIKHLLDSDNVVPPGTEVEAIQSITEKQNLERAQLHTRRSRERRRSVERQRGSPLRRRSLDRGRVNSPRRRSPLVISPERRRSPFKKSVDRHRSPLRFSPDKRRSPLRFNCDRSSPPFSPERRRSPNKRLSWERKSSADRRWSAERHRRRTNLQGRRRSRSRDRQRSRSTDRLRRKASRSPLSRRYTRRSRTRSRSLERRTRKRSPFINELARQLRNEGIMTPHLNIGYTQHTPSMDRIPPLMGAVYQPETDPRPSIPMSPYMHQPGPTSSGLPVAPGGPPFINFENSPQTMNFESVPLLPLPQVEYASSSVLYNQPNAGSMHRPPLLPAPAPVPVPVPVPSPQPVPAPIPMDHVHIPYSSSHSIPPVRQSPNQNYEFSNESTNITAQSYRERRSTTPYNGRRIQEERLKTPEPPVISDTKQFEKTSLSSLLEASVSAKDSTGPPILYPGFKPDILRHCEHALCELPELDPRFYMTGRFFFDAKKENVQSEHRVHSSNSILLQVGKNKIYWEEPEDDQFPTPTKQCVPTHQKICQTDEIEIDTKSIQATVTMVDQEIQVYPQDLQEVTREEKRPIMDRLDWNMRETYDYAPKFREADDLRWSLNNSSQKRSWSKAPSPPRRPDDREHRLDSISSLDRNSRNVKLDSPVRSRDSFQSHKGSVRDHYVHERYSPDYRHSIDERDDFHDSRSDHSRGESPMMLEDSGEDELVEEEQTFQRRSDWHGRGKSLRGRANPLKTHIFRGKHSGGRPYRGRGSFRGKF